MKTGGAKGNFQPNVEFILVYAKNINRATHFRARLVQNKLQLIITKHRAAIRDGEIYGEERLYS
jgi:adenine-specific DNA-methyltransferase